jgi:hypothetical protein
MTLWLKKNHNRQQRNLFCLGNSPKKNCQSEHTQKMKEKIAGARKSTNQTDQSARLTRNAGCERKTKL